MGLGELFGCLGRPPGREEDGEDPGPQQGHNQKQHGATLEQRAAQPDNAVLCLHVEGQASTCVAGIASVSGSSGTSDLHHADAPRIVLQLQAAATAPATGAPPSLQLCFSTQHATAGVSSSRFASEASKRQGRPWLHVVPVSANASACIAWAAQGLDAFGRMLGSLAAADEHFTSTLAEVALSVAAPLTLAAEMAGAPTIRTYTPKTRQHVPGGASLRVSSCYIRDPEDGTLRPALILELENVNLRQLPSTLTQPTTSSHPMNALATRQPLSFSAATAAQALQPHDQGAALAVQRAPSATNRVAGRRETQHKRKLLRAMAMISAVPCIATLLELSPSPPSEHSDGLLILKSDGSGLETSADVQLTGRVLMQNELSVAYWGKMTSRGDAASTELLSKLFEREPDAVQSLVEHLLELRSQGQAGEAHAGPWKKVVQVPHTCVLGRGSTRARQLGQQRLADSGLPASPRRRQRRDSGLTASSESPRSCTDPSSTHSRLPLPLDASPPRVRPPLDGSVSAAMPMLPSFDGGRLHAPHTLVFQSNPRISESNLARVGRQSQMGNEDQQQQLRSAGISVHPSNRVLSMLSRLDRLDHGSQAHDDSRAHTSRSNLQVIQRSQSTTARLPTGRPGTGKPLGRPCADPLLPGSGSGRVPMLPQQSAMGQGVTITEASGAVEPSSLAAEGGFLHLTGHPDTQLQSAPAGVLRSNTSIGQVSHSSLTASPRRLRTATSGPGPGAAAAGLGSTLGLRGAAFAAAGAGYNQGPRQRSPPPPPPTSQQRLQQQQQQEAADAEMRQGMLQFEGEALSASHLLYDTDRELLQLQQQAQQNGNSYTYNAITSSAPVMHPHSPSLDVGSSTLRGPPLRQQSAAGTSAEVSVSHEGVMSRYGAGSRAYAPAAGHLGLALAAYETGSDSGVAGVGSYGLMPGGMAGAGTGAGAAGYHGGGGLDTQQRRGPPPPAFGRGLGRMGSLEGQARAGGTLSQIDSDSSEVSSGEAGSHVQSPRAPSPRHRRRHRQPRNVDDLESEEHIVDLDHVGHASGGEEEEEDFFEEAGDLEEEELEEEEEEEEEEDLRWHEVQAVTVTDPVSGKEAMLLLQTDITARALMEKRMSTLTETQLTMLENMYPRQVLEFAMSGSGANSNLGSLAYEHEDVTVLFMDIVGFTAMSKEVQPQLVMQFLNDMFSKLDDLCDYYNVYKVDTAGDCYIVAGALMKIDEDGFIAFDEDADMREGARNVIEFAQAIMRHACIVHMPHNGLPATVRVGVHTGSVVSGLVGTKLLKFSLFGDTMNTSSRMESTSKPGCIQISATTYEILDDDQKALFKPTGGVQVKGKGLMATYINEPRAEDLELRPEDLGVIQEEEDLADRYSSSHLPGPSHPGVEWAYVHQVPDDRGAGTRRSGMMVPMVETGDLSEHSGGKSGPIQALSHGVLNGLDGAAWDGESSVGGDAGPCSGPAALVGTMDDAAAGAPLTAGVAALHVAAARRMVRHGSIGHAPERRLLRHQESGNERNSRLSNASVAGGALALRTLDGADLLPIIAAAVGMTSRPSRSSSKGVASPRATQTAGSPSSVAVLSSSSHQDADGMCRRRRTAAGVDSHADEKERADDKARAEGAAKAEQLQRARRARRNSASDYAALAEAAAAMGASAFPFMRPPLAGRTSSSRALLHVQGSVARDGATSPVPGVSPARPCADLFMAAAAIMSEPADLQQDSALNKLRKLASKANAGAGAAGQLYRTSLTGRPSPSGQRPPKSNPAYP